MDEAAIEKAGTKPLAPWLAKIDAVKSNADLPKLVAELHGRRLMAGYGFFVAQDQKESTRYIPMIGQGGLGLPDRDYYLKDDAKSKEIREKYLAHVAKMLELLGRRARGREGEGRRRDGPRDEAREGVAHACRAARPREELQQADGRAARRRPRPATTGRPTSPRWASPRARI